MSNHVSNKLIQLDVHYHPDFDEFRVVLNLL